MEAPTPEQLAPLVARHGLSGAVVPMPTGYVNWVYGVGRDVVLRVTKPDIDPEDTYTEAVAVPAATLAGIRTPRLIAFDDSRSIIPYVFTLYERAPGVALAQVRVDQSELPRLYRALGTEVAAIHTRITHIEDPHDWLDKPYFCDPRVEIVKAREALVIEMVTYDWLAKWAEKLGEAVDADAPVRFLHGDLHAGNTMVLTDPLRLSAVIDWGDANWGQAPIDFERVPVWAAPWMLEAYDAVTHDVDEVFVGKVLAHILGKTLEKAHDNEFVASSQPWHPFPSAFTFNLVRLMGMELDSRWQKWLPEVPI